MSLRSTLLGLSVSLLTTSTVGCFASSTLAQAQTAVRQPQVATIKSMVNGDLMCYVTLVDINGAKYREVGATFDICEHEKTFLNQQVKLTYGQVSINDCQSAEPCGKTRRQTLITRMELLNTAQSQPQGKDFQTLSNGEWTITIGNMNAWSGVNNTGNVSYYGCDAQQHCIRLTGGKVSCRYGICVTGWRNGEYFYSLEQPIMPDASSDTTTTLTVRKGGAVILRATGLRAVSK